jgi:MFS transporter, putative metabolite:H+ symporter
MRIVVVIAALGYLVDIYDLVLFSVLRVESLKSLGLSDSEALSVGLRLLNWQLAGLLVGGFVSGVLADKKGRVTLLLGSIFLYSAANIANAFVQDVDSYAWIRFIAGLGLAGELGTGITLVSEHLSPEKRGYGTMLVAGIGFCGAVLAALLGDFFPWRIGYAVGGGLGLLLLTLRLGVSESRLFLEAKGKETPRGDLWLLFRSSKRTKTFICCIFLGSPLWLIAGILTPFSPEICKAMGLHGVKAAHSVLMGYVGAAAGDFLAGYISQRIKSRKRTIGIFLSGAFFLILIFLLFHSWIVRSLGSFYVLWFILGLTGGYWAVLITTACEQFGTNLRATAATSIPNLIRATVIPLNFLLQGLLPGLGLIHGLVVLTLITGIVAAISLGPLEETYGRELDFIET